MNYRSRNRMHTACPSMHHQGVAWVASGSGGGSRHSSLSDRGSPGTRICVVLRFAAILVVDRALLGCRGAEAGAATSPTCSGARHGPPGRDSTCAAARRKLRCAVYTRRDALAGCRPVR